MTGVKVKAIEKRNILVGVPFDLIKKELLNWALIKVANPGDTIVAVHVCRNSGTSIIYAFSKIIYIIGYGNYMHLVCLILSFKSQIETMF